MIHGRARVLTASYVIADLAATAAALVAAHAARRLAGGLADQWLGPVYDFHRYLPLLALILPLWALVFLAAGLYGMRARRPFGAEMPHLARAIAVAGLMLGFVLFAFRLVYISRPVILLFLLLDGPFVAGARVLVRALVFRGEPERRLLVAGGLSEVLDTAARVEAHRDWGVSVAGLVSDGRWSDATATAYPVLGRYEDIPAIVGREVIDEVLIAPAAGSVEEIRALEPVFFRLEEQGIVTRLLVNFVPRAFSEISFEQLDGLPLLTLSSGPRDELLLFVRRAADLVLAAIAMVLTAPLALAIAVAIKASSPGPVLFRQTRCGLNGRPFTFLKFRSMRVDAEALKPALAAYNEMDGPAFKMSDDPRVTPLGRWLRRSSLDELPQLWNILAGDMTFVGPRPAVVEEVAKYEPWQRRRLSMKPGLTCLWQVSGRNALSFDEWMRLDLEYIDNWSLWLDVKIALKTIPAVLKGHGAR